MTICNNCGTQIQDGIKFCPACGKEAGAAPARQAPPVPPTVYQPPEGYQQPAQGYQQSPQGYPQPHLTAEQKDIQDNKVMAILAYIIPPIPWFAARNSKFAIFHAKQGMKLFMGEILLIVLNIIFSFIKIRQTQYIWGIPYETMSTPWFLSLIVWLISLPIGILAIIGLIYAIQGKRKAPPFLDKIPLFESKR